jgi:hypothetical protein
MATDAAIAIHATCKKNRIRNACAYIVQAWVQQQRTA